MRYLIALVVLLLPITAGAEQRSRSHRPAQTNLPQTNLPAQLRPVIPSSVAPREWQRLDIRGDRSHSSWRRFHHQGKMPARWFGPRSRYPFYGGSYYALPYPGYSDYYPGEDSGYSTAPPAEAEAASMRTAGTLRLDITPATGLQYYVDGMYIGSSSELGTEFEVNAGARRIEIRAEGYKPVVFDARFVPGGLVTRRGALEPLQDSATLPRATGSQTMFVIPGCFMGNARPDPGSLPKGCDIARLITR
jgi:hypothetical protein